MTVAAREPSCPGAQCLGADVEPVDNVQGNRDATGLKWMTIATVLAGDAASDRRRAAPRRTRRPTMAPCWNGFPEGLDPSLAELKRLRAALQADPNNLDHRGARGAAIASKRPAKPAIRASSGRRRRRLAPWWTAVDPPLSALLLRATVKQSQHDFSGALADLDQAAGRASRRRPGAADARHGVDRAGPLRRRAARLREARCGSPPALVTAACLASASSLNGDAAVAYRFLGQALDATES